MNKEQRKSIIKNLLWSVVSIIIAVFTITTIVGNTKNFSLSKIFQIVANGRYEFFIIAIISVFVYIYLEGMAIRYILRDIDCTINRRQAFLYSAADIYFSAITPSASGGQPATFYFMLKDGIPISYGTISLVLNLGMYGLAIGFIAIICFIFGHKTFIMYNTLSKSLIVIGFLVMLFLTVLFFSLLREAKWIEKIGNLLINLFYKLKIVRKPEKYREKIKDLVEKYHFVSEKALGKKKMLLRVFLINVLQRVTQITITVFVYLGIGGNIQNTLNVWLAQGFATIGSTSMPIPGAMGVVDYLMFQGFEQFLTEDMALHTELISRGLSFYTCIIISLFTVFLGYFRRKLLKNSNY